MRCGAVLGRRLLAAVPVTVENAMLRCEVSTSRRQLQAPIAIGPPDARLARYFGTASAVVAIAIRCKTRTVGCRASARFRGHLFRGRGPGRFQARLRLAW
jgi:hypothetical protein